MANVIIKYSVVHTGANIQSGGKTKMSAIIHGFFLLISVMTIPVILNKIPLSVLASILFIVGYKLAKPALFKKMYQLGWKQFVPFVVTILGIVFTDLLIGIGLGLLVGITVILIKSYQNSHFLHIEDHTDGNKKVKMTLAEEVTFINKGAILHELDLIPESAALELDVTKTRYLDNDVIEILDQKTFKRPIYAGNAIATVENKSEKNFLSIRITALDAFSFENVDAQPAEINLVISNKSAVISQ